MKNLYFRHNDGTYTLVEKGIIEEDVYEAMRTYVRHLNPKYRIHYIRRIEKGNTVIFDVGSHTEFFYLTERILPTQ